MRFTSSANAWIALSCSSLVLALDGVLSIPPSLRWDGADGYWSTFLIQVGSPAQTVRLLPGTSAGAGSSIWVVLHEGCYTYNTNIDNCAWVRGGVFSRNESTTWSTQRLPNDGLFQLSLEEESQLGLAGNALYGFDTLSLAISGQGLPTLQNQTIAGIVTTDFWIGSLGISPVSLNFSNLNNPLPSMMATLRTENLIGSTSWAYTAGAVYKDPPVFGSLTLGGFDEARLESSAGNVTVPFGSDFSRDLLLAVRSITYDSLGSTPLLAEGIYAFVDSMVSAMYLPISVCHAFEQAFNLTWDPTTELYLLTDEQHTRLLAQNPTFSFTISNTTDEGDSAATTVIEFPYSAFDLNITQPYVNETTRYFPLKQAQNTSQYTLGRVFLQEAYVIADYDRQQFTVAQAAFPQLQSDQNLQAIILPRQQPNSSLSPTAPSASPAPSSNNGPTLSGGIIAAIVAGSVVLLALVGLVSWMCVRKRKRSLQVGDETSSLPNTTLDDKSRGRSHVVELAPDHVVELPPNPTDGYAEMAEDAVHEIGDYKFAGYELADGRRTHKTESTRYEMAGQEPAMFELGVRDCRRVYELPAGK